MSSYLDYRSSPAPCPPEDRNEPWVRSALITAAAIDVMGHDLAGQPGPHGLPDLAEMVVARWGGDLAVRDVSAGSFCSALSCDPFDRLCVDGWADKATVSVSWLPRLDGVGELYADDQADSLFVAVHGNGLPAWRMDSGHMVMLGDYWVARALADAEGLAVSMLPPDVRDPLTVWPLGEGVTMVRPSASARLVPAACPDPVGPQDVSLTWSGGDWSLCCGLWTLRVGQTDCSWVMPEDVRGSCMGTRGTYSRWVFGDDYLEEWETYEDGVGERDWIERNRPWLSLVSDDPAVLSALYASAQACDFRPGSCGGCI